MMKIWKFVKCSMVEKLNNNVKEQEKLRNGTWNL